MPHNRLTDEPLVVDQHPVGSGPPLWMIVWQRKSYVALGLVLGVALGVLYYATTPRSYESSAQILVLKKRPDAPISAGASAATAPTEDFLETHQTVIRSSVILGDALAKGELTGLPSFQGSARPSFDLAQGLTVRRDRDKGAGRQSASQILNLSFRGKYSDDCERVLNAVIDSYRDFLNRSSQGSTREALNLITKARDLVQNDLDQKKKAYAEFQKNSPVVWKTPQGTTLHQERLSSLDAQRAALKVRAAQIRAALDAVDVALKEGRSRGELLEILSAVPGRTTISRSSMAPHGAGRVVGEETPTGSAAATLEQELIQLQLQECKLLEDYGPKHPTVVSVHERIQTLRGLLAPSAPLKDQTPEQRDRALRAKETMVNLKLGQLQQESQTIQRDAASLDVLYEAELREARRALPSVLQEEALRKSIDDSKLLFDNIIKRLRDVDLVGNFGGFDAQVITPPTVAEKVTPRGSVVFPVSALLGVLLGLGLVYLVEITDKSFRSLEDMRRRLGLPVLGVIPVLKPSVRAVPAAHAGIPTLDPSLTAWHRPKSREAEAYRGVRTALYFSTRGGGCKIVQITSPNVGDGKSTLAANLAISIARSGKRVLLVDADMRRPRLGKLFGLDGSVGFATLLEGTAEPPDAIQETPIVGLSLLPAGSPPPNPAELLTSPRLPQLLAWMRDQYDYILIDTPPLLAVTDPSVVGPQVDGVLLTLRSTNGSRVEAERSREVLDNLGVNIFGVIVNFASGRRGDYSQGYSAGNQGYYDENAEDGARPNGESSHTLHGPATASASGENGLSGGQV